MHVFRDDGAARQQFNQQGNKTCKQMGVTDCPWACNTPDHTSWGTLVPALSYCNEEVETLQLQVSNIGRLRRRILRLPRQNDTPGTQNRRAHRLAG
jgi:hypothetical protein